MANSKADRNIRVLGHKKQERALVKDGVPLVSELREGVPVFRRVLGKLVQFIKHNNTLYKVSLGESNTISESGGGNQISLQGDTGLGGPSIGNALVADLDPIDGNQISLQPVQGKDTISISPNKYLNKSENITVLRLTAQQDSSHTDQVENKFFVLNELQLKQVNTASWNGGSYFIYAHTDDESGVNAYTTSKFTVDDAGALVAASTLSCSEITSGAVIWQSFPFILSSATHSRYYFIDNDDTANSYRRWDTYDTDPTEIDYRTVSGNFVVPEDCTLVAMHGVIVNNTSTNNPIVYVYHGSITQSTGASTLASAGNVTVSIGTVRVPYTFSKEDFDTDLTAGDIVIPMIKHADTGGTRSFVGSLTLKFITR